MGFLVALNNLKDLHNDIIKSDAYDVAINCNYSDRTVSTDDKGTTYFRIDVIGLTISFLALTVVGFAILSDKRV